MIRKLMLLTALLLLAPQTLAKNSYKYNYTIGKIICDETTGHHGEFLQVGDVIDTWRWWFFKSARIERGAGPAWELDIQNSDWKDIFATVQLPVHGTGSGTEAHCLTIEYAGFDSGSGRHFVDLFLIGMNPGDTCDAELLDEPMKSRLRDPSTCPVTHNGSARGFYP